MIKSISNSRSLVFFGICFLIIGIFVPTVVGAWVIGDPIVPCGPNYTDSSGATVTRDPCTQCELLHLVDNLMDFILVAAAPILATFFFLVAGVYIMLGGAKPDMLATGKRIFSSALIGIIIVMLAWLITNTLITTLIAPTLTLGNMPFNSADWWQLYCGTINLNPNPPGSGGGGGGGNPPPQGCSNPLSTPPVCIDAVVATPGIYTATINWRTAISASSVVNYRVSPNGSWQTVTGPNTLSHVVNISGLTEATTYDYYVISNGSTSPTQIFTTLPSGGGSSTCALNPTITRNPNQMSYNNGDVVQFSITAQSGCTGFIPEVRVGPRVGPGGTIDWNQGIVIANPVMGQCVNSVCAVVGWTVNRFNTNTNSFQLRAVSDNGSGQCATSPSGCTEAYSVSFWIN